MITQADEIVVRSLVGRGTFTRGRGYAAGGRVLDWEWQTPARVVGSVRGTAAGPYRVSATLRRSATGQLSSLTTSCTCPVGRQCKHGVALLLAAEARRPEPRAGARPATARATAQATARRATGRRPTGEMTRRGPASVAGAPPAWEQPLAALLDPAAASPPEAGGLGLQLEIVVGGPGAREPAGGPGIVLRPVIRSRAGNWVRTGVAWDRLDYLPGAGSAPRGAADIVRLLRELLAMSRAGAVRYGWAPRQDGIRLESIASRRVWDLLVELRDLGAPLLLAGRASAASGRVELRPPVELAVDLTRQGGELHIRARYSEAGTEIPAGASLPVGRPPHGIVWWDDERRRVELAPLARPPSGPEEDLVAAGLLVVPERDTARFLGQVCPRLRRRVTVDSSDGSVDLSQLPDVARVLRVRHQPGHVVELEWYRSLPGGWEGPWDGAERAEHVVDDAVDAATAVVTKLAALTESGPDGERIRARSRVTGIDAVVFVSDLLPRLEEVAGLDIEQEGAPLPYQAASEAPVVSLGGTAGPEGDWFDLAVEVSVGGEAVAFHELFVALAEGRSHLILPSGTYFGLDSPQLVALARLIAEARALSDAPDGAIRINRYQASLWDDVRDLGGLTAQAEAWEASVRALTTAAHGAGRRLPKGLRARLRPYQVAGFGWLAFLYEHRLGGILADDMGLGKTLQALALVCHAREQGGAEAPFLVVAPTSVVGNWVSEAARFAPSVPVTAVTETTRRRGSPLAGMVGGAGLVVTSYALFRLDHEEYRRQEWAGLFLDEAQFVKNSASHSYRRARALPAPFKLAMTGTPLENNLMELWSLLSISAPGLFPKADRFSEDYRLPIERAGATDEMDRLRRRVRPFMLRRTKEGVATELPAKQEQVLELDLDHRHMRVYQTYLHRERQKVLGLLGDLEKNRFQIFRSLTLLRQASLDASLVDPKHSRVPSTKLDALLPLLEEAVADGHRVLVFSQFTRFLTLARRRVQEAGIRHCYLDGRTRRRAEVIDEFRQGKAPVFLVSLKAGGFGLNLTEADYCILLDPWWNPAAEAQAVDRVHRIGQTRKVHVYRLVAKDTIEDKVMALKAKKAALFSNVMDGGGFESGVLSAADIRRLVSG